MEKNRENACFAIIEFWKKMSLELRLKATARAVDEVVEVQGYVPTISRFFFVLFWKNS